MSQPPWKGRAGIEVGARKWCVVEDRVYRGGCRPSEGGSTRRVKETTQRMDRCASGQSVNRRMDCSDQLQSGQSHRKNTLRVSAKLGAMMSRVIQGPGHLHQRGGCSLRLGAERIAWRDEEWVTSLESKEEIGDGQKLLLWTQAFFQDLSGGLDEEREKRNVLVGIVVWSVGICWR